MKNRIILFAAFFCTQKSLQSTDGASIAGMLAIDKMLELNYNPYAIVGATTAVAASVVVLPKIYNYLSTATFTIQPAERQLQQQELAALEQTDLYAAQAQKLVRTPRVGKKLIINGLIFTVTAYFTPTSVYQARNVKRTSQYNVSASNCLFGQLFTLQGPSGKYYQLYVGL